jgi:hypothetical protein
MVRLHFEVELLQTWYYQIFLNSHTLVILLYVNVIFCDQPKIVCEGFYEIEDISMFASSLIFGVGHYHWLCGSIH